MIGWSEMKINWKKLRQHISILSLSVGLGFITQSEQILAQVSEVENVSQEVTDELNFQAETGSDEVINDAVFSETSENSNAVITQETNEVNLEDSTASISDENLEVISDSNTDEISANDSDVPDDVEPQDKATSENTLENGESELSDASQDETENPTTNQENDDLSKAISNELFIQPATIQLDDSENKVKAVDSTKQTLINQWVQDTETGTWNYYDHNGEIVSHMNETGYWINDEQQYDQVLFIPETGYFYFDTKANNGVQIQDRWGYSSVEKKWHYGGANGVIQSTLAPLGYWVQGNQLADVVVEIPKHGFYFFEGWDNKGHMAIDQWAYSPNEQKWHYADKTGLVNTTLGRESYWIYGEQQFDSVAYIPEVGYYYVDDDGKMAINEWAYSNSEKKWHYGGNEGIIASTLSPDGYWVQGKQFTDVVVEIPNHGYYYFEENNGRMATNKWSYSPVEKKWHKTSPNGIISETFSKLGYWSNGVQQYDTVVRFGYDYYYFSSKAEGGKLSDYRKLRTPVEVAFDTLMWPGENERYSVNMPLMLQTEPRWSHTPYGTGLGGIMKTNGCAIASLAMVESYLEGKLVTPDEVAKWAGLRYWVPSAGTAWSIFNDYAYTKGYKITNHGRNYSSMTRAISNGSVGIVSVGPGKYTTGGHLMAIRGYNPTTNALYVNDPNDTKTKQYSITPQSAGEIMASAMNFWTFTKR